MSFLPIVNRELLEASKRKSTFNLRLIAALISLAVIIYLYTFSEIGNFNSVNLGRNILVVLSSISFTYCLLAGVFCTSDCLSSERRHGTMGLLFLTRLKSYDVTAGKLAANSLNATYGLVASFPILALSILFGGVTDDQFIRTTLALSACLALSLSIGLLASALYDEAKNTMAFAVLILLAVTFAPPLLERLLFSIFKTSFFHPILFLVSPFTLLKTAWLGTGILPFWISFFGILALASASFAMSTAMTSRWRQGLNRVSIPPKKQTRSKAAGSLDKAKPKRALSTRSKVDQPQRPTIHPFQGIAAIPQSGNRFLWTILGIGSLPFLWMFFKNDSLFLGIAFYSLFPFHLLIKVLLTADACRNIHSDKQSGFIELLCITPQPIYLLPYAYFVNLQDQYRRPALFLTTLNIMAIAGILLFEARSPQFDLETVLVFFQVLGGGALMLFVDFQALIWVSIKQGLTKTKVNQAIVATMTRVMLPAWIGLFVLFGIIAGSNGPSSESAAILVWQLAALGYSVQLIRNSKAKIKHQFLEFARQSSASASLTTKKRAASASS